MIQIKTIIQQFFTLSQEIFLKYYGKSAPHRTLAIAATVAIILWIIYKILTRGVRKYMSMKAQKQENIQNFMLMWRYVWMGIFAIFFAVGFSGSIATLGISAAFLGMILGWSLQSPVTGIAAWLMILLKRPFRIGDRVIISGITGDVIDITLTHILLNQVGGTIGGEEKSGRIVLIPNATLFQQIIFNYTFGTKYLLDEVIVTITFGSDFKKAERILLRAARKVTKNVIEITNENPFVRVEIADSGVRLKLRYKTLAKLRQETSSDIVKMIIAMFNRENDVEFAYPHSEVVYRAKKGNNSFLPPIMEQIVEEHETIAP